MSKNVLKYINYTKEAFFLPFHLIAFGILAAVTLAILVIAPFFFGVNAAGAILLLAGLELLYLGLATKSKRFRRAINAKYSKELQAYYQLRKLTVHYNELSAPAQRRYEDFRKVVNTTKKNYNALNSAFPDLVKDYMGRLDKLQYSYIRLLSYYERSLGLDPNKTIQDLEMQISKVYRSIQSETSERIRRVKRQRMQLLEDRIKSQLKLRETRELAVEQLKNMEEMLRFFSEQPFTKETYVQENGMIDEILLETSDLHQTLSEVEEIMESGREVPLPPDNRSMFERNQHSLDIPVD